MALRGKGSKHTRIYGWRSLKQPNLTIDSHKVILRVVLCEIKFHIKSNTTMDKVSSSGIIITKTKILDR